MSVRNAPAPDWQRRAAATAARYIAVVIGALLLSSGCGGWPPHMTPHPGTPMLHGLARGDSAGDLRRDTLINNLLLPVTIHLAKLPWGIPEYHDEQPFWDPVTRRYGPMANVFVQPYLGTFNDLGQFNSAKDSAVLAAVVWVDKPTTGALTTPYTALGLQPELNCVYLTHQGSDVMAGWRALVMKGDEQVGCPRPTSSAAKVPVQAVSRGSNNSADYPAVARFEELNGRTLIGVKCLNRWCLIGVDAGVVVPYAPHLAAPGARSTRAWRINGWYDLQMITAKDENGVVLGRLLASVIPADNLERLTSADFEQEWTSVATVWLSEAPPAGSLYATKWKLRKGLNDLVMKYFPSEPEADRWRAGLRDDHGNWINESIPVSRHEHFDILVPGTARWRFLYTDEIIWVRCDQGCCQVDATSST